MTGSHAQTVAIDIATIHKGQYKGKTIAVSPIGICSVRIDVNAIPDYQRGQLAEFALELTRNIFARPGEEERYQEWLAKRKAAEAAKQGGELIE